jgi:aminopeptidase N
MIKFLQFKALVLIIFLSAQVSVAQQSTSQILQDIYDQHDVNVCSHTKQKMLAKKMKGSQSYAAQNIDITYTRMQWNINPTVTYISGVVTPYFTTLESLYQINLEKDTNLIVDSIVYHGQNINYADSADYLMNIYFPGVIVNNAMDSLSIYYHGVPSSSGFGSFVKSTHNGEPIIWTLSEPYGAREWWPCKNDLSDKIDSIDVIVSCPKGNRAASNGLLVKETHTATTSTYHWRHRHPIATYLVAIAVTNYAVYSDYANLTNGTVEVLNYVFPEDSAYAAGSTPSVIGSIQLYSNLFIDYPFMDEKYGHAQFGWGGGMEHQTMSFMGGFSYAIMAHELAHQWFGDMVTCGSWHDIWLNEGFATYLTGLNYEAAPTLPYWETWKRQTINDITSSPDGSVYCDDTTSVGRIFSSRLSYSKGAYVLHMMRWVVGDSAFYAGIRNYLQDANNSYGYAKTDDLKQHVEASSGMDLTEFFDDWYYGEGYPIYEMEVNQLSNLQLQITLHQAQSNAKVSFFEMPVPIRVFYADGTKGDYVLNDTIDNQVFNLATKDLIDSIAFDPDRHLACLHSITSSNVGIQSILSTNSLVKVYPNPVNDELVINSEGSEIQRIELFDAQGKLLKEEKFIDVLYIYKINMTNFVTGCYYLRITCNNSTDMIKILKQ